MSFMELSGTDNLQVSCSPRPNRITTACIVTDATRRSDLFSRQHREQLFCYSPWQKEQRFDGDVETWHCSSSMNETFRVYLVLARRAI